MFIRLKTTNSNDVNVNMDLVQSFEPQGDWTQLTFNDGTSRQVTESTRSIRGYIKKAQFQAHTGGGDQNSPDDV